MFLAWREIRQNKLRFALVTAVLLLVSYLVFFLSGLASGLAGLNREAVDKWQADGIYLTDESDKSLTQSMLEADLADEVEAEETAVLAQMNLIADNGNVKSGVALFGIRPDEFIMPEPTEGEEFSKGFEVIASDSLKEEGFSIGDVRLEHVGFILQSSNLVPFLTVSDQLKLLEQVKKGNMSKEERDGLLEELGITKLTSKYPNDLSGGERQRVAIAKALYSNPSLLLADEPTASLDSDRAFEVMKLLKSAAVTKNAATIVVTHDNRLTDYVDKVYKMVDGVLHLQDEGGSEPLRESRTDFLEIGGNENGI